MALFKEDHGLETEWQANQTTSRALEENENNDADLDRQQRRQEKILKHKIKQKAFLVGAFIAGVCLAIYLIHIIGPHWMRWLTEEEVDNLRGFAVAIGTGVFSALASGYLFDKK